jgi:Tfp pilus assembly protein PilW
MRRLLARSGGHRGFTTVELLVGMFWSLFLLGLVLTAFIAFSTRTDANNKLTAAEDSARSKVDQMVASLRSAAGASGSNTVVSAGDYDLAVNTDNPGFGITSGTAGTARFCVDTQNKLWFSWIASPNSAPGAAACPAAGWTATNILSSGVANRTSSVPLFSYSSAVAASIRSARVELAMTTSGTSTTRLKAGVFFRSRAETSPTVNSGDVTDGGCSQNAVALTISSGLGTDANGDPNRVIVYDNGQQIATGVGTKNLTLAAGVHILKTRVYNVLGKFTDVDRTVSC